MTAALGEHGRWQDDAVRDIAAAALSAQCPVATRIIGIDGPSGSGKSTMAKQLQQVLSGSVVIHVDDFVSWDNFAGWWPRFEEEVLRSLRAGVPSRYQVRDWERDEFGGTLGGWKDLPRAEVAIIEGVTCTRRAASQTLSYAVWVDADPALRLSRGIARDGEDHRDLWLKWMSEEAQFFAADGTAERANIRLRSQIGEAE